MPDMEKVIKGLTELKKYLPSTMWEPINNALVMLKEQEHKDRMYHALEDDWERLKELLKEQEAVEPKVSCTEQRCGNCNYVIEMDGWKSCPWCGKMIDWEKWWNKNGTHNNTCRKEERSVK